MPFDAAQEATESADDVTFEHDQCATVLPEGVYAGKVVCLQHALGINGMGRSWLTVRIVGGTHDGSIVSIWTKPNGNEA